MLRVWRATNEWSIARYPDWAGYYDDGGPLFQTMRFTRVPCSCAACGNPRRHFGGVTRQERRADDRMRAEICDILRTGGNGSTLPVAVGAEGGTGE